MTDMLMELLQKALKDGVSWGLLITAYLVYRKHRRNRQLDERDRRWEAKFDAIMKEVGASCVDTCSLTTEPSAEIRGGGFIYFWLGRFSAQSVKKSMISNMRRNHSMQEYLKKLGQRKFQAYLLVTIVNIITFVLYVKGYVQTNDVIDKWMPAINLLVQMISTLVYQAIEGSIDREAQKQQVYVVPGSAPVPDQPAAQPGTNPADLSWSEIITKVKEVNDWLNGYLGHLDKNNLTSVGQEAVARYIAVHDLLSEKDPLPPAQVGGAPDATKSVSSQN